MTTSVRSKTTITFWLKKIFLESWKRSQEIPRNWFKRTIIWKFLKLSTNFLDIFYGFSAELVTRNSLELVTRNSLDRVMRISSEWVAWNFSDPFFGMGNEKFLGIAVTFSLEFPEKDSWEFPQIFRKIVT